LHSTDPVPLSFEQKHQMLMLGCDQYVISLDFEFVSGCNLPFRAKVPKHRPKHQGNENSNQKPYGIVRWIAPV